MGLSLPIVDTLVREHRYPALSGDVLLIGRQAVYFSPAGILSLLLNRGLDVRDTDEWDIEIDLKTLNRCAPMDVPDPITDRALFRLRGVPKVLALGHSDYEGADIVRDLTKPTTPELRYAADFVVDGSTLDNVFDPVTISFVVKTATPNILAT